MENRRPKIKLNLSFFFFNEPPFSERREKETLDGNHQFILPFHNQVSHLKKILPFLRNVASMSRVEGFEKQRDVHDG